MELPDAVKEELEYRIQQDNDCKFDPRSHIKKILEFDIVSRNDWQGLVNNGKLCVPSIFDKVTLERFNTGTVAMAEIMGYVSLWMEIDGKWKQICDEYAIEVSPFPYHGSIVLKDNRGEWLFSVKDRKLVFNEPMELVSRNLNSKLIWGMKRKEEWWFLTTEGSDPYIISGNILPLEHNDFAFYMESTGELKFLEGDSYEFRKKVAKEGGRIELGNSRTGRIYYSDAFAQILNS